VERTPGSRLLVREDRDFSGRSLTTRWTDGADAGILSGMKRCRGTLGLGALAVVVTTVLIAGCVAEPRHPRDHPSQPRRRTTPMGDRLEEPGSELWPLTLWLEEFARRNGAVVRFDDRDVLDMEVVRPKPGPWDSDAEARRALDEVLYRFYLHAVEEKPHVYRVVRDVPRPR